MNKEKLDEQFSTLIALRNALKTLVDTPDFKWDFSTLGKKIINSNNVECGTAGCAIGYLPILFPKDYRYNVNSNFLSSIYLKVVHNNTDCGVVGEHLGITEQEFDDVFYLSFHDKEQIGRALSYYNTSMVVLIKKAYDDYVAFVEEYESDSPDPCIITEVIEHSIFVFMKEVKPVQVADAIDRMLKQNYNYEIS